MKIIGNVILVLLVVAIGFIFTGELHWLFAIGMLFIGTLQSFSSGCSSIQTLKSVGSAIWSSALVSRHRIRTNLRYNPDRSGKSAPPTVISAGRASS